MAEVTLTGKLIRVYTGTGKNNASWAIATVQEDLGVDRFGKAKLMQHTLMISGEAAKELVKVPTTGKATNGNGTVSLPLFVKAKGTLSSSVRRIKATKEFNLDSTGQKIYDQTIQVTEMSISKGTQAPTVTTSTPF